jgi:hypothetical protein
MKRRMFLSLVASLSLIVVTSAANAQSVTATANKALKNSNTALKRTAKQSAQIKSLSSKVTSLETRPSIKGDKGEIGAQGPQGLQGIAGTQGAKGDKGDIGAQGQRGLQGIAGLQGVKGDKGDTGAQGLQGIAGPQGAKGDKGDKGDAGSSPVFYSTHIKADLNQSETYTCTQLLYLPTCADIDGCTFKVAVIDSSFGEATIYNLSTYVFQSGSFSEVDDNYSRIVINDRSIAIDADAPPKIGLFAAQDASFYITNFVLKDCKGQGGVDGNPHPLAATFSFLVRKGYEAKIAVLNQ